MNEHPKAAAARAAAQTRNANREIHKATLAAATEERVRFVTVGNTTVCYRAHQHDVLVISTALRNRIDNPDPLLGKVLAYQRMNEGNFILVKKPSACPPKIFLKLMFGEVFAL